MRASPRRAIEDGARARRGEEWCITGLPWDGARTRDRSGRAATTPYPDSPGRCTHKLVGLLADAHGSLDARAVTGVRAVRRRLSVGLAGCRGTAAQGRGARAATTACRHRRDRSSPRPSARRSPRRSRPPRSSRLRSNPHWWSDRSRRCRRRRSITAAAAAAVRPVARAVRRLAAGRARVVDRDAGVGLDVTQLLARFAVGVLLAAARDLLVDAPALGIAGVGGAQLLVGAVERLPLARAALADVVEGAQVIVVAGASFGSLTQPRSGSQLSSVHSLSSSHSSGPGAGAHRLSTQTSAPLHASPSWHASSSIQPKPLLHTQWSEIVVGPPTP